MIVETPNFSFFDKCPRAVFYFLSIYLRTLEESLLTEHQVDRLFDLNACEPMPRLNSYRAVINSSRNKELIKHLLLFLFQVYDRAEDQDRTLEILVGNLYFT